MYHVLSFSICSSKRKKMKKVSKAKKCTFLKVFDCNINIYIYINYLLSYITFGLLRINTNECSEMMRKRCFCIDANKLGN